MSSEVSGSAAPEVVETVLLDVRDDGPKGYYGPRVELLLMDDGGVRWRFDSD